jgi:hypothetical protein
MDAIRFQEKLNEFIKRLRYTHSPNLFDMWVACPPPGLLTGSGTAAQIAIAVNKLTLNDPAFHPLDPSMGLLYPTLLGPVGCHTKTALQPFQGLPPARWAACGCLFPLWAPHALPFYALGWPIAILYLFGHPMLCTSAHPPNLENPSSVPRWHQRWRLRRGEADDGKSLTRMTGEGDRAEDRGLTGEGEVEVTSMIRQTLNG